MQEAQRARAEEMRKWRASISMDKFKDVRKKFTDAGIDVHLLCFNMRDNNTDDDIEYAFQMGKALGVKALTTSTTVTMSKRIAPFAEKHKMLMGYHGHDQTSDPNEFATLETYATAFSYGKYNGVNLDIGHFTASNYDAVAFIKEHHARITNLHLKDRQKDHGPNTPWGQGDTPLKEVLQLMKTGKYPFPANIEYEYRGESDVVTEIAKCLQYCKDALA
jgi:sugar phosphate isomerase/epimerase